MKHSESVAISFADIEFDRSIDATMMQSISIKKREKKPTIQIPKFSIALLIITFFWKSVQYIFIPYFTFLSFWLQITMKQKIKIKHRKNVLWMKRKNNNCACFKSILQWAFITYSYYEILLPQFSSIVCSLFLSSALKMHIFVFNN